MTEYEESLVKSTNAKFKQVHGGKTKRVGKKKIRAPYLAVTPEEYTNLERFYVVPTWIVVEEIEDEEYPEEFEVEDDEDM